MMKLRIVIWLLLSSIRLDAQSNIRAIDKELLRIEQELFDSSLSENARQMAIITKMELFLEAENFARVLTEGRRIKDQITDTVVATRFTMAWLQALLATERAHEGLGLVKWQLTDKSNRNLKAIVAMVYLRNQQYESFEKQLLELNPQLSENILQFHSMNPLPFESNYRWLPKWYWRNNQKGKSILNLFGQSIPPSVIVAGILGGFPVAGVVIGGYLAIKIYGDSKNQVEKIVEKENRKAALNKQLFGLALLKKAL